MALKVIVIIGTEMGDPMEYPKKVMNIKELVELGFPDEYLRTIFRRRNQKIAWKMSPGRNSTILFDTDELEKYRIAQCVGR